MTGNCSRNAKILIIDDEAAVAEILRLLLELEGYKGAQVATDPFVAVQLCREIQPDLVVLDLLMPRLSGLEVLAQLRASIPAEAHLPILVVSGDPKIETRSRVLREGASDFVGKPYDADEILARIANLLETRSLQLQLATKQEELEARTARLTDANAALRIEVEARERSEAKLRSVTESVGDAIVSASSDGKINFWNRAAEKIFGYREDEVLGKPLTVMMPKRYRERHSAGMARLQAGGEARLLGRTIELEGLRQDGSEFPIELTLSTSKTGDADFFTGVVRDVTERKAAQEALRKAHVELTAANERLLLEVNDRRKIEEALRKSEEQLRFTLEATGVGEWEVDLVTGISRRSLRHDQIFGYDSLLPDWTVDLFLQKHVHPDDRARVEAVLKSAFSQATTSWEMECRIFRTNGEERFIWVKGAVRRTAPTAEMSGLIMDITSRKHAEEKLRLHATQAAAVAALGERALSGHNLMTLFNAAVTLVAETIGVSHSTIFQLSNDGLSLLVRAGVGWREGVVGQAKVNVGKGSQAGYTLLTKESVIVEDWRSEKRFTQSQLLRDHEILSGISVIIGREGQPFGVLAAHSTSHQLLTAEHIHFLQAISSLLGGAIERSLIEETLREAKETAERANAAKSEFLSRMSHELRTPLNAILGFGQLLEMDGRDPEEADNIEQILKAGRHLLGLINEVLDISRIEAGRLDLTIQPHQVSGAIEEALALVRPLAAEHKVALKNLVRDRLVLIDQQRFQQVLLNLLSNGIKYNRPGGCVTLAGETDGGKLRLTITDTGIGIAAADMRKVFIAFERLSVASKVEGIGLGLAISKRLIDLMGGRMGVESTPGKGSTFWIEIPLAESAVELPEHNILSANAGPAKRPNSKTLLYIEDNLSSLRLIARILARRPAIELLSAETAALGLQMAREHHPDLILLDLHLPDSNGDQVLAQLRADPQTSEIPVVMFSAEDLPGKREQMLNAGARAFLTKPVEIRALLAMIDQFIVAQFEKAG